MPSPARSTPQSRPPPRLGERRLQRVDEPLGLLFLAGLERNELSDQSLELAWQRLSRRRQIVALQPVSNGGEGRAQRRCHGIILGLFWCCSEDNLRNESDLFYGGCSGPDICLDK